jgi:hypothetical protein
MIEQILLNDTFTVWMNKINAMGQEVQSLTADPSNGFKFDTTSVGLNAKILAGKFREMSTVIDVPISVVSLPPSTTSVVCIYKKPGLPTQLVAHPISTVPSKYIIPLWGFQTNGTSIISYTDLRTPFVTPVATASSATSMLYFDRVIEASATVPAGQGAVSVSPTVNNGVTVTVEQGADWVVL